MKRIFYVLALLLTTASTAAQSSEKDNKELVKQLIIESFDELFSNPNPEKLGDYYTEDFLLLENGEVWDNEIIVSHMDNARGQEQPERINSFDFVEIKIQDKTAWVAYYNNARFLVDGKPVGQMNWLESAIAVLTEDGWRLQLLHSTLLEEK
jgi:hypothetical protein